MNGMSSERHGLILSGGGSNGAYEIGVLKALFAGKSRGATGMQLLDPYIFAGTSVGSFNAAYLVSRWDSYGSAAIASLEQVWLDTVASTAQKPDNAVFRIREDPRPFLDPRNLILNPIEPFFNLARDSAALAWDGFQRAVNLVTSQATLVQRVAELIDFTSFIVLNPFKQLIVDTIPFSEIRRSQKKLIIVATNWEMGRVRYFENHDLTDTLGPAAILGSTGIPGIFPPAPYGSQLFVDGGVLENTPLNPLIDRGANILHVISMFPNVENIVLATMENTLATVYRQQLIGWTKTLESSIRRVRDINRALRMSTSAAELIREVRERLPAEDLSALGKPIGDIEEYLARYRAYTPLTVHRYFPTDDISGPLGLLDFDRDRLQELIERGFEDAVDHNCQISGCVFPTEVEPIAVVGAEGGC